MVRLRFPRALIVPAVIASLMILPAAAQAAPGEAQRDGGGAGISLLGSLFEWVANVWGAGGPTVDPAGNKPPTPPEAPAGEGTISNTDSTGLQTSDGL